MPQAMPQNDAAPDMNPLIFKQLYETMVQMTAMGTPAESVQVTILSMATTQEAQIHVRGFFQMLQKLSREQINDYLQAANMQEDQTNLPPF